MMRSPSRGRRLTLTIAVLCTAPVCAAFADDDATSVATTCLTRYDIRSTKVLNDRNILFVMRDRTTYNNPLPRECRGMHRGSPLAFAYADSKLCAGSTFTVLMRSSSTQMPYTNPVTNEHMVLQGPSLTPIGTCQLGMFAPVTADEVDELKAVTDEGHNRRRRHRREAIEAERVELPPGDAADSASPANKAD